MIFAGTEITPESILATRQWFADLSQTCISEAAGGAFHVDDIAEYTAFQEAAAKASISGKWDNTFAFTQRAHYIQTGTCVPLFRA